MYLIIGDFYQIFCLISIIFLICHVIFFCSSTFHGELKILFGTSQIFVNSFAKSLKIFHNFYCVILVNFHSSLRFLINLVEFSELLKIFLAWFLIGMRQKEGIENPFWGPRRPLIFISIFNNFLLIFFIHFQSFYISQYSFRKFWNILANFLQFFSGFQGFSVCWVYFCIFLHCSSSDFLLDGLN